MLRRDFVTAVGLTAALAGAALAWPSQAAGFPDRAVKLVLGFPPGTAADLLARELARHVAEQLGWTVVVDNRPGAGGQIAALAACRSAPDGHTLLLAEPGSIAIAPAAFAKLAYDPARELMPLATLAGSDMVLVVPASLPVQGLADYLALLRSRGQRALFSTLGAGSPVHFAAEMLGAAAGFAIEPVHFRAASDATTALANGDVQGGFASIAVAKGLVATGRIRALATTSARPLPQFPQLPTFAHAGLPQLGFTAWFALFAPSGTPEPAARAIEQAVLAALRAPGFQAMLLEQGFTPMAADMATTQALVRQDVQRWAQIVKASGFRGD